MLTSIILALIILALMQPRWTKKPRNAEQHALAQE